MTKLNSQTKIIKPINQKNEYVKIRVYTTFHVAPRYDRVPAAEHARKMIWVELLGLESFLWVGKQSNPANFISLCEAKGSQAGDARAEYKKLCSTHLGHKQQFTCLHTWLAR